MSELAEPCLKNNMIYHEDIPEYVQDIIQTSLFQRLKDVGMNCGNEYTQFEPFCHCRGVSRYQHSIGVALIVYHFTQDKHQVIAALLHDIASPVFAHVIDFMHHDYLQQVATENLTEQMIKNNHELQKIFLRYHIDENKVINYHDYPIADNDTPQLSADRLEYTLSNALYYGLLKQDEIKNIYHHLHVNETKDEIVFDNLEVARLFTQTMLQCSQYYVCDANRYCMEYLARLMRYAIENGICTYQDLYTTETQVIQKLMNHPTTKKTFEDFTQFNQVLVSLSPQKGYFKVQAKKRYINPKVYHQRILDIDKKLNKAVQNYLNDDFHRYVKAIIK